MIIAPLFRRNSARARVLQEQFVACLGHPLRPPQVSLVGATCRLGLHDRIDPENDSRNLIPWRALHVGIKQTEISDQVRAVIWRQFGIGRGLRRDFRFEFRSIAALVSGM